MSAQLRIFLGITIIIYFGFIFRLIKKKNMFLKYALLWLLMGVILAFRRPALSALTAQPRDYAAAEIDHIAL